MGSPSRAPHLASRGRPSAPLPKQIVLELGPTARNRRNSEPSFVTLRGGRILMAYCRFGASASDFGPACIASRYSDDGGLTWSARDRVLVPRDDAVNVMSPTLLRLQDGRIALFSLRKERTGIDDTYTCQPWVRYSVDECRTFGPPLRMIRAPGYFNLNNDRVIQLASGRLLAPVCLHSYRTSSFPTPARRKPVVTANPSGLVSFYYSDGGHAWYESVTSDYRCLGPGRGLQEPGVVERADGTLLAWCRAGQGPSASVPNCQWRASSRDGGLTWTPFRPWADFPSPCSPLSIKRVPDSPLLLAVWNDRSGRFRTPPPTPGSKGRTPLVSAVSRDHGRTWGNHRLIEAAPDRGFAYTAIHFAGDDVLLGHGAGGGRADEMGLQRLRINRVRRADLGL